MLALEGMTEPEMCDYVAEHYPVSTSAPVTGSDVSTCAPGTITADGIDQYRKRIDFYRGWYGLQPTGEPDPARATGAQECAAMMASAQQLSHYPDPNWACYTEAGAETASFSNLGFAYDSPAQSIDVYMFDFGNEDDPGHRRWLLFPPFRGLGYGWFDAGPGGEYGQLSASCVVMFWEFITQEDLNASRTEKPIAYPPPGAFPVAMASITNLAKEYRVPWSVSWSGADFANAELTLTDAKTKSPIPLEMPFTHLSSDTGKQAATWLPQPRAVLGDRWSVRIEGVTLDGAPQLPIVYEVEFVGCGVADIFG